MTTTTPARSATATPAGPSRDKPRRALGLAAAARVIAGREVAVTLRDRGFIVSTLVTLVIVAGATALPAILSGGTETRTVAVVDDAGAALVQAADELAAADAPPGDEPVVSLDVLRTGGVAAAEEAIREDEADLAVLTAADDVELVALDGVPSDAADVLSRAASVQRAAAVADELGATDAQVAALQPVSLEQRRLGGGLDPTIASVVATAFGFLFSFTVFGYGMMIAQRVTEEKQSRVVELLVAAVPMRAMLVGKVLGVGALALGQVVLTVGIAAIGASLSGQGQLFQLLARSSGWFLVFFLFGFALLACLFAAAGAMAPRQEDLQQTVNPLSLAMMLPFFASVFITDRGPLLTTLSYVPLTSPLTMPRRLLIDDAAWWEPVLSLGVLAVSVAALVVLGARLYERSLLRTGSAITWRSALRRNA
ncbi:ABC-2 type transport system permease protein [Geodermatophilus pulveris]|uniref:ABC-2 type transport system permease protein n=1 Tax=Geodermatophilus pulveris TaxID=1564159 RepID=A0A239D8C8_9ACTN|nr:ABC transporter permease [Geodermatophilus pulveris]SNS28124.1 ABC-2 type transport system permease protein [Geodermatophilus pulveris]